MDRFFLTAMVCELAPRLVGQRVRSLRLWSPAGLALTLSTRPRSDLVISLLPEASAFFVGRVPLQMSEGKPTERSRKRRLSPPTTAKPAGRPRSR